MIYITRVREETQMDAIAGMGNDIGGILRELESRKESQFYPFEGVQEEPSEPKDSVQLSYSEDTEEEQEMKSTNLIASFQWWKNNFEKASDSIRRYDKEIMDDFNGKDLILKPREDVPGDTQFEEVYGRTIPPEKSGDPIIVEIQTKVKDEKDPHKKTERDPLSIGEDIVHEHSHAKMLKKLGITKSEYEDPSLKPFLDTIGEALCYKQGADYVKANNGHLKQDHARKQDRYGRFAYFIECVINNKTPELNKSEEENYQSIKQKYDTLKPDQQKRVRSYIQYYEKNIQSRQYNNV